MSERQKIFRDLEDVRKDFFLTMSGEPPEQVARDWADLLKKPCFFCKSPKVAGICSYVPDEHEAVKFGGTIEDRKIFWFQVCQKCGSAANFEEMVRERILALVRSWN